MFTWEIMSHCLRILIMSGSSSNHERKSCPDYLRIQLAVAWLYLTMSNLTVKEGLKTKKIKLSQISFFLEKQLMKFSCSYLSLSFCKI